MMPKVEDQVVELDEAAVKAIAEQVKAPEVDLDALAEKMAEKQKAADEKNDKEINKLKDGEEEAAEGEVVTGFDKMSKEAFVVAQVRAIVNRDSAKLGELNKHAYKTLSDAGIITKTTYDMTAGVSADGGALVPNAQLLNDVFEMLPEYSAVAGLVRQITLTDGDSLDISSLTADVAMVEVSSEGGTKGGTKPTLASTTISVREFAGIVPLTKKLLKQSAMDVYSIIASSFARAIAKEREELILTDSSSGIVGTSGVVAQTTGSASSANAKLSSITWEMLAAMPFAVPTASAAGGTFVFSRLLLGQLAVTVDSQGRPIIVLDQSVNGGSLSGTFLGYPFVVAESLGTSDAASTTHAVFGNWGKYGVLLTQGTVDTQVFDSGTVVVSGTTFNLIQQNMLAVRVETWENVGYPLPGAFVALSTAAAS